MGGHFIRPDYLVNPDDSKSISDSPTSEDEKTEKSRLAAAIMFSATSPGRKPNQTISADKIMDQILRGHHLKPKDSSLMKKKTPDFVKGR